MNFYPSFETLRDASDGPTLLKVSRSPRAIAGYIIAFLAASLVTYILIRVAGHLRIPGSIPVLSSLSVHILILVPIGIVVETVRKYHDDLYLFDKRRITHKGGRLSLRYNVPVIKYAHIRAIRVTQSVIGRILDYGDVELNTAAKHDSEIMIAGVRAPDELAKLIDQVRVYNREQDFTTIKTLPDSPTAPGQEEPTEEKNASNFA